MSDDKPDEGRRLSVRRYRGIEEMPPPWRESGDPGNLRAVAEMLALHRRLSAEPRSAPGVTRFRRIEDLKAGKEPIQRADREGSRPPRRPGTAQGEVRLAPDFDEPFDEFEDYS